MKRKRTAIISIVLSSLVLFSVLFAGCDSFGGKDTGNGDVSLPSTEYTIQYTDNMGSHNIKVKDGEPYALESIPKKTGYEFIGLFDAEVGGTQYVSAAGQSISPYIDKKNMVLFPQFRAKEYMLVLDYQGAAVTGERSFKVKYGENIPELPKNLAIEHSEFSGWYTEENCGGIQVADAYGILPDKAILNENTFDITHPNGFIYLYAGFESEKYTVIFNYGGGIPSEEVEVAYGTPISEVVPETRNSDGFAVYSWSKTSNGSQIFTGKVTDDLVLYAVEWAPVITFQANGGNEVRAIVAREGDAVIFPVCVRENYKFQYWQTESGVPAVFTSMPSKSVTLKAVWQAIMVFDENGGIEVKDISEPQGTRIELPVTEKDGYIFAGWYSADKQKYTSSAMPQNSVVLKAGWHKVKKATKVIVTATGSQEITYRGMIWEVNLAELDAETDFSGYMFVQIDVFAKEEYGKGGESYWGIYSSSTLSDGYLISEKKTFLFEQTDKYYEHSFSVDCTISNGVFFVGITENYVSYLHWIKDFYVSISYPDTSNLYL